MTNYEIALALLKDDLQAIPLNYYKKPKLEFANVPITEEFIEDNQEIYETSKGLGLLCRGIWCMDIDVNHTTHENGFDSLKELEDVWPDIVRNGQNTYVQTTPRGGKHLVFKKVDGIDYGQHIGYLPGVDIKAHDNNFFVFTTSKTVTGTYSNNEKDIQYFDGTYLDYFNGTFEDRIFSSGGTFEQQTQAKYRPPLPLDRPYAQAFCGGGKSGKGKEAYQRIINGDSYFRNNDLYFAATYAKEYNIDLEPLMVLIGTRKGKDVLTEKEFWATVNSAGTR